MKRQRRDEPKCSGLPWKRGGGPATTFTETQVKVAIKTQLVGIINEN